MEKNGVDPRVIRTTTLFYIYNGTTYGIDCYNNTFIRFEILSEEKGYLTVRVTLSLHDVRLEVNSHNSARIPKIWKDSEMISQNTSHGFHLKLRALEITGTYKIRESDDAVFSMNGKYYGHTFLWMDHPRLPPPVPVECYGVEGRHGH